METEFAPAERAAPEELSRSLRLIAGDPVINGLMKTAEGFLLVLNPYRQILAVNDAFLRYLRAGGVEEILGLRPGEAVGCVYADEHPGGCGTSRACGRCGAVLAVLASIRSGRIEEERCALSVRKGDERRDLYFRVRSCPISSDGESCLLVFFQDATREERRAGLERAFFHDLNNIITNLVWTSDNMREADEGELDELCSRVRHLSLRLANEVSVQRMLLQAQEGEYRPSLERTTAKGLVEELREFFEASPVARDKTLRIAGSLPEEALRLDTSLVLRIMTNMLVNAFEATGPGGEVRLWVEEAPEGGLRFCVWNDQYIPGDVACRIFQCHFTTKKGSGRGIGTYAMKLFADRLLGGAVDFTTSEEDGTVFRLLVPAPQGRSPGS